MKDVAREAGVALGTVSKVVNGLPVGEAYRLRVEEAIARLNYRVNNYARGLRSERTHTITVIVPNLSNPFFAKLTDCLCRELARHDYRMLLCVTDTDPEREQENLLLAKQQMVDGIICCSYNAELWVPEGIPMVSIDRYFGAGVPCVCSDNYGGGRLAAQKLADYGCKNLAFLRTGSPLANETDKRKDGFLRVCDERNLPCQSLVVNDGAPYKVFEEFLQAHLYESRLEFDGIFCATDALAVQIMTSLRGMGVRVPEDVQIIGFDGVQYFGGGPLYCSTIVQPVEGIAEASVDLVLAQPSNKLPYLICLPVTYVDGGTTRV